LLDTVLQFSLFPLTYLDVNKHSNIVEHRGGARGVPGEATAPLNFACLPPVPPQKFSASHHATGVGHFLKVLLRPLTAPLVAKLAPPVAPPNENVWLRPW